MKKAIIITLIAIAAISGAVFAYVKCDLHIAFIDNYAQNFSDNLFNLRLQYEMRKAEKEEEKMLEEGTAADNADNIKNGEQDSSASETQSSLSTENAEETELATDEEDSKVENIAVPGKHEISSRESVKIVKTQKKSENGESIDVLTKKLVNTRDPIAFVEASKAKYEKFRNGILCASENQLVLFEKNGNAKFTLSTSISNPILKVSNPFILIWESDSNKAVVYENNKEIYTISTADKILTGYISSMGECVLVTSKPYYKGEVKVYNKSGEEIFSRSFGSESVLSAAISDSRKLAVSLLLVNSQANSKVAFFDINKTEEESNIIYENTIIYDLEFYDNSLIAYADNKMISLKSNGKEDWVYSYNERTLNHCSKDNKDIRLLIFDNLNNAELTSISLNGKEQQRISTDIIPNCGDICDGYIIFNSERNLYLSRLDGTLLSKYAASRDIHKAYFIDSDNILIVYNSSIEFLHIEKGE